MLNSEILSLKTQVELMLISWYRIVLLLLSEKPGNAFCFLKNKSQTAAINIESFGSMEFLLGYWRMQQINYLAIPIAS